MTLRRVTAVLLLISLTLLGALYGRRLKITNDAPAVETALRQLVAEIGLTPLTVDPIPRSPEQIALGRALFFETELSGNRDVSCATCHRPALGLSDGLPLAVGVGGQGVGPERRVGDGRQYTPRNSLDLANRGLPEWETLFWDGRVTRAANGFTSPAGAFLLPGLDSPLAAQAALAVVSRHEMRGGLYTVAGYLIQPGEFPGGETERPSGWSDRDIFGQENELAAIGNAPEQMPLVWERLMIRLLETPAYPPLFAAAYPGAPLAEMDFSYAANALAAFQTDAFTFTDTPWDRYLAGDREAISLAAKQGALLFYGEAGCARCHSGSLFTDQRFHNIGAPQFGPGTSAVAPLDYGRYNQTNQPEDRFAFRTPSLRNATLTAPYLHNGAYDSLEEVIRHHQDPATFLAAYDGRRLPPDLRATLQNEPVTRQRILQTLSPLLADSPPLTNRQIGQILAFLDALTMDDGP
jgi:cytochrome c peroxidase